MPNNEDMLEMTSDIVGSMVANNTVPADQLPSLIASVYAALAGLGQKAENSPEVEKLAGAVTARRSLADPNVLISMIDGKSYSSLNRHLGRHGYTPESYREAFGLKPDYPMVAPGYSERRRDIAKKLGLGRKAAAKTVDEAPTKLVDEAPTKPKDEAPTKPVDEAPAKPVADAPTKPVDEAPAKAAEEASAKTSNDSATAETPAPKPKKSRKANVVQPVPADDEQADS